MQYIRKGNKCWGTVIFQKVADFSLQYWARRFFESLFFCKATSSRLMLVEVKSIHGETCWPRGVGRLDRKLVGTWTIYGKNRSTKEENSSLSSLPVILPFHANTRLHVKSFVAARKKTLELLVNWWCSCFIEIQINFSWRKNNPHKSTTPPWNLTWIPKIAMFGRGYIFQTIVFGIYVRFQGWSVSSQPAQVTR